MVKLSSHDMLRVERRTSGRAHSRARFLQRAPCCARLAALKAAINMIAPLRRSAGMKPTGREHCLAE